MRDTIEMAREAGFPFNKYGLLQGDGDGEIDADKMFKAFEALVRADEREVSLDAVLRVIKELYPALVLAAFSNRDKAWAIDKIKENIEKLKETK
jgi:glycine/serine hydroxymethyltransferase